MIKIYGTFLTKKANIKFKAASTVIIHFSLRNTPLSPRRKKIIPMRTAKIVGIQMPPMADRITTDTEPKIDACWLLIERVPMAVPYPMAAMAAETDISRSAPMLCPSSSWGKPISGITKIPIRIIIAICNRQTIR